MLQNRHTGESRRLISDVKEIVKTKKLKGFLSTMDTEKAERMTIFNYNYL